MKWQRIGHLWWFDLSYSLVRVKGLIFLIPFLAFWYPILRIINNNLSVWMHKQESLVFAYTILDPEIVTKLLVEHPPSLSIFFLVALWVLPFFAILAGIGQFASDLGNGYFKLTSTRCLRIEVFISRFLSVFVLMATAITLAGILAALISANKDNYSVAEVIAYLVRICVMLYLYSAALLALMTIISSLSRSMIGALFFGACGYLLILFIIWWGNDPGTLGEYLPYLLPSAYKQDLLHVNDESSNFAMISLCFYTLIYGGLGWCLFRRSNF